MTNKQYTTYWRLPVQNNLFVIYNDNYITEFKTKLNQLDGLDAIFLNFSERDREDGLNCRKFTFGQIMKELFSLGAHTYWFLSNRIKNFDFHKINNTLNEFKCTDIGTISYVVNPTIMPFNYYKCKSYKTGICEVPLCEPRCFVTRREVLAKSTTVNADYEIMLESLEYIISHFTKSLKLLNLCDFNKSVKNEKMINLNYSSVMNKLRKISHQQNLPDMINLIDSISTYAYENNTRNNINKIKPILVRSSTSS